MRSHPRSIRPAARSAAVTLALAMLAAAATPAWPQAVTLDEGVFRIAIAGRDAGSETFSIRLSGSGAGATIVAAGRIAVETGRGGEQITTQLQLTAERRLTDYQLRAEGAEPERVAGQVQGNRFTAQVVSPRGERMREYIVGARSVLLDPGIAHQYYFVAREAGESGAQVPLIIPREGRQVQANVVAGGTSNVQIEGTSVTARVLRIQIPGEQERTVWVDARDRVLRVEVPAAGYVAQRTTLPR